MLYPLCYHDRYEGEPLMSEGFDFTVRIADDGDRAVRVVGDQVLDIGSSDVGELVTVESGSTLGTRTLAEAGIQPLDSDLTALAALSTTTFGRSLLTLADAAAALTAIGAQPSDSDLTAIAALTTSTYGRALLTLADRAALISLLALSEADVTGLVADLAAVSGKVIAESAITTAPTGEAAGTMSDLSTPLSVTGTVGTRPIIVEAYISHCSNNTTGGGVRVGIVEGSTVLQDIRTQAYTANATPSLGAIRTAKLSPSAGSHTYKVQFARLYGGTATLPGITATSPGIIRMIEA